MIDTKILVPLAGLIATVFAVNAISNKKDNVKEDFGMLPSFDLKVNVEAAPNAKAAKEGKSTNVLNNYRTMVDPTNSFYTVPGNYQSIIAPRFFGGDYGANITYNLPSRQNLAVPHEPLDYANDVSNVTENFRRPELRIKDVKEGFCASGGCNSVVSCQKGGDPLAYHGGAPLTQPGYADGNYNKELESLYMGPTSKKAFHSNLPVGDMTTLNALGNSEQPIVYDRYMFANRNSRLRSQGDKIRGDLAIVPNNNGWFNVSVQPNVDLEQGAMNVLGGVNNQTSQELADLIYTTSGNYKTAIGGVNMVDELGNPSRTKYHNKRTNTYRRGSADPLNNVNMSNEFKTNLSAGMSDINVVAYP